MRSSADALASAIFPADCTLCNTPLARLSRAPVCSDCWESLEPQSGILCVQCGEALGAHPFAEPDRAPGDWLCRPCRMVPPAFDRAVSPGRYGGTLRELIHRLKYDRMEPLARPLGARMAALVAAQPAIPTTLTVVPVPLFRSKRRERGFNQADLLARAVVAHGSANGLTLQIAPRVLLRTRATESQAGLSPAGRRRNLAGAFAVAQPKTRKKPLAGQDVLLVDDIYTTGATARAASAALRRAGAREIWVVTAARAQRAETVQGTPIRMEEDIALWD